MAAGRNDEMDLLDLWRLLWRSRVFVVGTSLGVAILAVAATLVMPTTFRAEVLAAPTAVESGINRAAGALAGLGGLASLTSGYENARDRSDEGIAVIQSRQFIWQYIDDQDMKPMLYADDWDAENAAWRSAERQPSDWDAYRLLVNEVVSVSKDKTTGFVTIAVEWTDPSLAARWANTLVAQLNDYMRARAIERSRRNLQYLEEELARTQVAEIRQSIFQLIGEEQKTAMMANTQKEFAFQVLDDAATPDRKAGPKRTLTGVLAFLIVFTALTLFVLAREQIRNRKTA